MHKYGDEGQRPPPPWKQYPSALSVVVECVVLIWDGFLKILCKKNEPGFRETGGYPKAPECSLASLSLYEHVAYRLHVRICQRRVLRNVWSSFESVLESSYRRIMNRGSSKWAGPRVPVASLPAGPKYPRVLMSDPTRGSDGVYPPGTRVIDERGQLLG